MITHRSIHGFCRCPPFTPRQHRCLVVFGDQAAAALANIFGLLRLIFRPAQLREPQRLEMVAFRAWHMEEPLVAFLEFTLNAGKPLNGGCADHEYLSAALKRGRPTLCQQDRITFAINVPWVRINFVHKQVSGRHRAQTHSGVCACHDEQAAQEILAQDRVAAIALPRGAYFLAQFRHIVQKRIDTLFGVTLGQLHGWRNGHHRPWRCMDDVTDPVIAAFRPADLRSLHEHDALYRRGRRKMIHDFTQVWRAGGAPTSWLGSRFRGEETIFVRPFRHQKVRIGLDGLLPDIFDF